ncbi:MAG: ATP-binding protein [Methylomicrobium sp.]
MDISLYLQNNKKISNIKRYFRSRKFPLYDENNFADFYAKRMYLQAKNALILGFFTWCAFSIWDFIAFSENIIPMLPIRLLLIAPCIGFSCWVCINEPDRFIRNMQSYLSFSVMSALVGIFSLILVATPIYGAFAYTMLWPGLLIVYLFQYAFSRLRFKPAALLGVFSFFVAWFVGIKVNLSSVVLSAYLFYLASGNILGMMVCSRMETYERTVFLMRRRYIKQLFNAKEQKNIVQKTYAQLKEVAAEKERFLSAAYHDLQQPLSTIGLYMHSVKSKLNKLDIELEPEITIIDNAKNEISYMFQEVTDIANIGRVNTNIDNVEINHLLDELEREFIEKANIKELKFKVKKRVEPPFYIKSDRVLLKRVLANLVSNSIKYTDKGGIIVGAIGLGSHIRIDVWDTGKGIPSEFKSRIFDEYIQLDNPGRDRARGLGLGLSIVKRIITVLNDHGHRLSFSSKVGQGSRFSIDVPIAHDIQINKEISTYASDFSIADVLDGKYVVVVEDEYDLLNGIIASIESVGCVVKGADSVSLARDIFAKSERCPDILITDFRLKDGETAIDVIEALQSSFEWEINIRVLIVTGELIVDDLENSIKNFEIKYDIYRKPINFDVLYKRLATLVVSN